MVSNISKKFDDFVGRSYNEGHSSTLSFYWSVIYIHSRAFLSWHSCFSLRSLCLDYCQMSKKAQSQRQMKMQINMVQYDDCWSWGSVIWMEVAIFQQGRRRNAMSCFLVLKVTRHKHWDVFIPELKKKTGNSANKPTFFIPGHFCHFAIEPIDYSFCIFIHFFIHFLNYISMFICLNCSIIDYNSFVERVLKSGKALIYF